MRTACWPWPAFALVLVGSACRIEVLDPDPSPPETILSVTIGDLEPGHRVVDAVLHAGVGPEGRSRSIPDPSLRLGEASLEPDSVVGPDGILALTWNRDLVRSDGSVDVAPPVVADRTPGALTVGTRRPVAPVGRHRPGDDLVLLAASSSDDSMAPRASSWRIEIEGFSGPELERTEVRTGAPFPESIRVPAMWLPRATDSLRLTVEHSRVFLWTSQDAEYRAAVAHHERIFWTVLVDPAPDGRADLSSR